ncbi:MAG: LysR family transcriptional regulator [Pseudolabrys sp.]
MRLDTHLLACLNALITEAHVSRAASRMNISQPSMSIALGRLRQIFNDPLLVKTRHGMTPTPRALEIVERVRAALTEIEGALVHATNNPYRAPRDFRIVILNSLAHFVIPPLTQRLRTEAPETRLILMPSDVRRTTALLEDNECDLVVGYPPAVSSGLHSRSLIRSKLSVIASTRHPTIRDRLTLAHYGEAAHVVLGSGPAPVSTIENTIDQQMRARRMSRKIGMRVPDLMLSGPIVAATDMIGTIPDRLARYFARSLDIRIFKLPIPLDDPTILMIWSERTHRDPAHRWMRQLVRESALQATASTEADA